MSLIEEKFIENVESQAPIQPASNALSHLNLVQTLVRRAEKESEEERKLIELLKQELQLMKTKVDNFQQQIMNILKPAIEGCSEELGIIQLQQKEDNVSFQNQITELKKEKMLISQMISSSNKHTQDLIQQIGGY